MSSTTASAHSVATRPRRIDSIDFWRGIVLCTIFINHIPGNVFEFVTQKNFGFSDSAEAFVFLSGASLAVAYAPRFAARQTSQAIGAIARRAVRLYGLHIGLSLAGMAIFAAGAIVTENSDLLGVHGRDLFVDDPAAALVGLLSLGHQLGYFNILPLYVLLLAPAALFLWIGRTRPWLMLAVSSAAYGAARLGGVNIPTWPMKGSWFFDPFTWQLMLALGLCAGLVLRRHALPQSPVLIVAASAVAAFSCLCVTDAFGLAPGLRDWAAGWADLDKTVLGVGRIVHFAAMAYLIAILDVAGVIRRTAAFAPLCLLGRNSLWVFAILSLLAAVGQVIDGRFGHSPLLDGTMLAVGFAALYGAALLLETRRVALHRIARARDQAALSARVG